MEPLTGGCPIVQHMVNTKGRKMHVNNAMLGKRNEVHAIVRRRRSFDGTYTATITPFTLSGEVDEGKLQEQIKRQIEGEVDGIVPCGTTGESPTLTVEEHIRVIELSVKFAGGRIQVLAGTGGNSTDEAIHLTKAAERVGADGSLQVVPYYNKPTQEGLFKHFSAIAKATRLPIILYDIPSRCGVGLTTDTVCRIRNANPSVVGIKVANGSSDYVTELRMRLGPDFIIFSGDDSQTLPFMAVGADGVISVVSNLFPQLVVKMVSRARAGDFETARNIHFELFRITKSIFLEGNPIGVKSAMEQVGLDSGAVRLPLVKVSPETAALIRKALNGFLNHVPAH